MTDTNGVKWIDGKYLPIEGRAFDDVEHFYDRLPANVTTNVNGGVRGMKHHTSGMLFRFKTDSKRINFKWQPYSSVISMHHMPSTGVSGIDVYRWDAKKCRWFHVSTGDAYVKASEEVNAAGIGSGAEVSDWGTINITGGTVITEGTSGIGGGSGNSGDYNIPGGTINISNATVEALPPRKSGINKPVVFYGTSITHGGCASRPGLAFVNRVGRDLDVPVVGLGFSGSGVMEFEMSEHLARIDASCYVPLEHGTVHVGRIRRTQLGRKLRTFHTQPSRKEARRSDCHGRTLRRTVQRAGQQGQIHPSPLRQARRRRLEEPGLSAKHRHVFWRRRGYG